MQQLYERRRIKARKQRENIIIFISFISVVTVILGVVVWFNLGRSKTAELTAESTRLGYQPSAPSGAPTDEREKFARGLETLFDRKSPIKNVKVDASGSTLEFTADNITASDCSDLSSDEFVTSGRLTGFTSVYCYNRTSGANWTLALKP